MSEVILKTWPELYKQLDNGKLGVWRIAVHEPADIVVTYGQQGGKLQVKRDSIKAGKNVGKKNATTPAEQALNEAESRYTLQVTRKQYVTNPKEAATTRAAFPMLAYAFRDYASDVQWNTAFAQPKLDGMRCIAEWNDGKVALYSKERKPITVPVHIIESLTPLLRKYPELVLDGELYHHGTTINKIISATKKRGELTDKLEYHLFDVVADAPFSERFKEVHKRVVEVGPDFVTMVKTAKVRTESDLLVFQRDCLDIGYEGSMLRHTTSGYVRGKRTSAILKFKEFQEDDFKIVDAKEGRGTHQGCAIFVCETEAGYNFDVLAPGPIEEKRNHWARHKERIGQWVTVKFFSYSATEEPVPYHLAAIKVRPNKGQD